MLIKRLNYQKALKIYKRLIDEHPDNDLAKNALVRAKAYLDNSYLLCLIDSPLNDIRSFARIALLSNYVKENNISAVSEMYDIISRDFPGSPDEAHALFSMIMLNLNNGQHHSYLDIMQTKFPDMELTLHTRELLGEKVDWETFRKKSLSNEQNNNAMPNKFMLHQNFPNPFNPLTTIEFDLPEMADISLIIYDINGREIVKLISASAPAGYIIKLYGIVWTNTVIMLQAA